MLLHGRGSWAWGVVDEVREAEAVVPMSLWTCVYNLSPHGKGQSRGSAWCNKKPSSVTYRHAFQITQSSAAALQDRT